MNRNFTNKEKIAFVFFVMGLMITDYLRRHFIWNELFVIYSFLMSFLQGVFTFGIEYLVLKRWVKNKKLLIIILLILLAKTGDGSLSSSDCLNGR